MIELLSPAGNEEKLAYAYRYGADAAYIGLGSFSLRARADNFSLDENLAENLAGRLRTIKGSIKGAKKLYAALNIYFRNSDLAVLERSMEKIEPLPIDAFIVSDLGAYSLLRRRFPGRRFHLSTQANCSNAEAAKAYRDLGFSRIILGREVTLAEIEEIRRAVPEVELESFVHGAMCLAYSGRCYLSAYLTGRSANRGDCTHSCRWHYRLLEEKERPGEYFPVEEEEGFTTILSSKDLNMFDHLRDLANAGIDSIKIEGRMKSLYYTAVVTRAYRRALDSLSPPEPEKAPPDEEELEAHRRELENVSHREYSTGFYYGTQDADETTRGAYRRRYEFLGLVKERAGADFVQIAGDEPNPEEAGLYRLEVRNSISDSEPVEFIGPNILSLEDAAFELYDGEGNRAAKANRGPGSFYIRPSVPVEPGYIIRKKRGTETP